MEKARKNARRPADMVGWRRLDDHQRRGADLGILGVAGDPARSVLWAVAWPAQPESGGLRASPGKGNDYAGRGGATGRRSAGGHGRGRFWARAWTSSPCLLPAS